MKDKYLVRISENNDPNSLPYRCRVFDKLEEAKEYAKQLYSFYCSTGYEPIPGHEPGGTRALFYVDNERKDGRPLHLVGSWNLQSKNNPFRKRAIVLNSYTYAKDLALVNVPIKEG